MVGICKVPVPRLNLFIVEIKNDRELDVAFEVRKELYLCVVLHNHGELVDARPENIHCKLQVDFKSDRLRKSKVGELVSHAGHNVLLEPICLLKVNHLSFCERLDNIVAVAVLKELSKGLSRASEDILHGQVDNRSLHELVGIHLLKVVKTVVPKNVIFQDLHFHFFCYGLPNQVLFCQLPQLILRLLGPIRCFEVICCDVVQHKQDVH